MLAFSVILFFNFKFFFFCFSVTVDIGITSVSGVWPTDYILYNLLSDHPGKPCPMIQGLVHHAYVPSNSMEQSVRKVRPALSGRELGVPHFTSANNLLSRTQSD